MTKYIFQYATINSTDVIDSDLISLEEAKELWEENYPKAVKSFEKGIPVQMCIWKNMDKRYSFGNENVLIQIDNDYILKAGKIYPPTAKPIPSKL